MSKTPDNLEQIPGEEMVTAPESGIFAWEQNVLKTRKKVKSKVVKTLDKANIQEQNEKIPPDSQKIQEQLEKLSENPRDIQLCLFRHYPYEENSDFLEYTPLLEMKKKSQKMTPEQKKKLKELGGKIKIIPNFKDIPSSLQNSANRIFSNPQKTLVICDDFVDKGEGIKEKRATITARDLEKQFPGIRTISVNLPESDKGGKYLNNQALLAGLLNDAIAYIESILPSQYPDIDTVIIVSNRSYVDAFNKAGVSTDLSAKETIEFFEKTGFVSYDFNLVAEETKKKGKYIPSLQIVPDSQEQTRNRIRALQKAEKIQSRSLDPLINTCKESAILERNLYYEEKPKDTDNEDLNLNETKKKKELVRKDFKSSMFRKGGEYSKFIVRGHVGEGKTIYLTELVKQFALEEDSAVRFVVAKDLKIEDIENLFPPDNPDILICIDALDEANDAIKNAIKTKLGDKKFTGRCIITTRYSESFGILDKDACELYFNPLSSERYIDSRFPDDTEKATDVKDWLDKQGLANEVRGNPLLLNLVVLLASATDAEKKWMKTYGISEYNKIETKSDLYENAVRFVLIEHVKGMDKENVLMKDLDEETNIVDKWMERLGRYAYDISGMSDDNSKKSKNGIDPYFDKYLSFLAKKTADGNYEFIHKSFYEYFLAKYLSKMPKEEGNQKIYDFRELQKSGNWNDWREFHTVVLFYGEMLAKDGKWERFLGEDGLLKNDDIFGENFFMGLEILYKLSDEDRNNESIKGILKKYEEEVESWGIYEIMMKFTKIEILAKNVGYSTLSIFHKIFQKIKDFFYREEEYGDPLKCARDFLLTLVKMGDEEALEKYLKYYTRNVPEYRIILRDAKENPIVIHKAMEFSKILIAQEKYLEAFNMYMAIAKTGEQEVVNEIRELIEININDEQFLSQVITHEKFDKEFFEALKPISIRKFIPLVEMFASKYANAVIDIYMEIMKAKVGIDDIEKMKIIDDILGHIGGMFKNGTLKTCLGLYLIVKNNPQDVLLTNKIVQWARIIDPYCQYGILRTIYCILIESGNELIIKEAMEYVDSFTHGLKPTDFNIFPIYRELIHAGRIKLSEKWTSIEWVPEEDKSSSAKKNKPFSVGKIHDIGMDYLKIAQVGNVEALEKAKECVQNLLRKKEFKLSWEIHIKVIELERQGDLQKIAVRVAIIYEWFRTKSTMNPDYQRLWIHYESVMNGTNTKQFDKFLQEAEDMYLDGDFFTAGQAFLWLTNAEKNMESRIIDCIKMLISKGDTDKAFRLYSPLAKNQGPIFKEQAKTICIEALKKERHSIFLGAKRFYQELQNSPDHIPKKQH